MKTVVHVTHEALQKIGGIGAVLEGLCTSPVYQKRVQRNILVGPIFDGDQSAADQLRGLGEVHYAGALGIDTGRWAQTFRPVEEEFGASFIYGHRLFRDEDAGRESRPEVLLVGIGRMKEHPLAVLKLRLWERFGIQSDQYDAWDYEQYTRIALPAYRALQAMGVEGDGDEPVTLMAHEYMGMPTALLVVLEANRKWRTLFYAHETATVRRIVEKHPGHDTMFYNALRQARAEDVFLEDVFGSQKAYFKHPLVAAAHACDGALAVGDFVCEELRFLSPKFRQAHVHLTYNGIPAHRIDLAEKLAARRLMQDYAEALTGTRPDLVATHVARLALSKGLWRDLKVLWHLDLAARKEGWTAVVFVVSTEMGGPKPSSGILQMESRYGWPLAHREGYPDLSGGEAEFYATVQRFNTCARNIRVVFVNQFVRGAEDLGEVSPAALDFMDLRKGTDLEFGQSIYEPFGIAQLEPLAFGGVCVPTGVCGCAGFLRRVGGNGETPNTVIADYTRLPEGYDTLQRILQVGMTERGRVEEAEAARVAAEILRRLPRDEAAIERLLDSGYELAQHMGWDAVAREHVLPAVAAADALP